LRAASRDGKLLPLYGLYARVIESIEHSSSFVAMLGYIQASLAREGIPFTADTYTEVVTILEALARDGWVKPIKLSKGPALEVDHRAFSGWIVLKNRDAELPEGSVAESIRRGEL
jgi:hypothetical protein